MSGEIVLMEYFRQNLKRLVSKTFVYQNPEYKRDRSEANYIKKIMFLLVHR